MTDPVCIHAERVLHGTTLADKLTPWPEVDVRAPTRTTGSRNAPPELGRPVGLGLPSGRRTLPSIARVRLQEEHGRARVLHELMNHELQAIELLSLALLRWPDAPAGFRRGLVATLRDEQRHCQLYIDRLTATGGQVGQQEVSGFFWETLSPARTAAEFVAGLSLTFESANLDFCQAWKTRFARAGDAETARVLQGVYDDEIRHVAHGLVWFTRWNAGQDRLEAWEQALISPLTPARARGVGFDRQGRARAGFTAVEIERLRLVGGSRGRPPRVMVFDGAVEDRVAGRRASKMARAVTEDLAVLPMFLLGAEDVVLAPSPSVAFLGALQDAGFAIPRFVETLDAAAVGPHPVRRVERWGAVPNPVAHSVRELDPMQAWNPQWTALSSKCATAVQAAGVHRSGCWVDELGEVWTEPREVTPGRWVLKAPYSTSGTARILGEGPLTPKQLRWLDRRLAEDGCVLFQPWYERLLDVSVHLTVGDGVTVDGFSRFQTGPTGVYQGAVLGSWSQGLPPELARAVHDCSRGPSIKETLHSTALAAGRWAQTLGYRGPLSIDGVVVQQGAEVRVHPWLETNARHTLGRVALALGKRVSRRSQALWRVERWSSTRAEQLKNPTAVMGPDGIRSGVLPTTDPRLSTSLLTWIEARVP